MNSASRSAEHNYAFILEKARQTISNVIDFPLYAYPSFIQPRRSAFIMVSLPGLYSG